MSVSRDIEEVRHLFGEHVPEIKGGAVEIVRIAREKGHRVIVAVHASVADVCPVGSCVGPKGERVKAVMKGLSGDKIQIVRWSDVDRDFIRNVLAPIEIEKIEFDVEAHKATIWVSPESVATLGKDGGMRLRLISRLVDWSLELIEESNQSRY